MDELPLGATVVGRATRFVAYATTADACAVRLFDVAGNARSTHRMRALGRGIFEITLDEIGHGALYAFVLGDRQLPDPYARFLPLGVHGPAMVIEPRYRPRYAAANRPLREHVLYELHVGCFTPEGTYEAARARLQDVASLGVTAIELMPLSSFPGERGWGYDGVAHFAPFAPYGTPDELRELIDAAHRLGLGVLLDVVYNHFGPSGNYLAAYSADYFRHDRASAWGDAPDFTKAAMRRYVLDNVRYWLTDFGFDGLRLDATHAIIDDAEPSILGAIAELVGGIRPRKLLVFEDERNDAALMERGLAHAVWADDFHHQLHVTLTGERDGYYRAFEPGAAGLARAIVRGWIYEGQVTPVTGGPRGTPADGLRAEQLVYALQNHDQIGNRALGDRLTAAVSLEAFRAATMLLLFLPMTPLLFMGQEWAASAPFPYFTDHDEELGRSVIEGRREEFKTFAAFSDPAARARIPSCQDRATFESAKLDWGERDMPERARVLALTRRMLELRRTDPVLASVERDGLDAKALGEVLVVRATAAAGERVLVVNLGATPVDLGSLGLEDGTLSLVLDSGDPAADRAEGALPPATARLYRRSSARS